MSLHGKLLKITDRGDDMAKKGGLGRGLNALFDDNKTEESNVTELKLTEIEPNKSQPRKDFDDEALSELADSIAKYGVLQPLMVRPLSNGGYQLVAGERRWRASRIAGLKSVPVVIRELSDTETMEIALIENLQREDLNPLEEALGYKTLMEEYSLTQEQVSSSVGKSRSAVANSLRLLNLPNKVQKLLKSGDISAGHARTLLSVPEDKLDEAIALIKKGASVREIENLSRESKPKPQRKRNESKFVKEVRLSLEQSLLRKVEITESKSGSGKLSIEFFSHEDLISLVNSIADKD